MKIKRSKLKTGTPAAAGPAWLARASGGAVGPCAPSRQDGSILIIVLWWLTILAILAVAVYAAVSPRISLADRLKDRATLHYLAEAAVQLARSTVKDDDTPGFDSLNEAWSNDEARFKEIQLGNARCSVGYLVPGPEQDSWQPRYGLMDEERRLNLNRVSDETLVRLLEQVAGLTSLEAKPLAAAIIDWRDKDDNPGTYGAEGPHYQRLSRPYPCKDAPFQVPEELLLVKGMTISIYSALRDYITVFGNGPVNINTADAVVLEALGLSAGMVNALLMYRAGPDGIPGTADDNVFENVGRIVNDLAEGARLSQNESRELRQVVNAGVFTVRSDNFRGQLFRQLDNRQQTVQITFVFNRNGVIRFWNEF